MENNELEINDNQKKNSKTPYVIGILLALILVTVIISSSYAYFTATVTGTSNNNVVTTGTMEIEFSDGPQVGLENALPGASLEKTFSVRNTGTVDTYYDIYMSDLINNFADKTDLVYTLSSSNGANILETQVPDVNTKIVQNKSLSVGETHNYTLRITFKETNDNQDDNKGKTFSTVIRVNEVKDYVAPYTVISGDLDTVGSEVCIKEECFYVIGQEDANHVKLLSKYNLGVGNGFETPTNIQDPTATGQSGSGNVSYSTNLYWLEDGANYWESDKLLPKYGTSFPVNVYTNEKVNNQYILPLAEYIDNYVNYLKNQGSIVTGRLLYYDELIQCQIGDFNNNFPSYWFNSVFWLGTLKSSDSVYTFQTYGYASMSYRNATGGGVRPVIIMEK